MSRTIRVGLLHLFEEPLGKTDLEMYEENIELPVYADEIGLDSVSIAEHHFLSTG
jgi:alkanesulfonate monooxygenase SsuD/methylene tetrahydromethanopterin reductase-like flavin-dependent oxidoreductase (luciferase family)